MYGHRRGTSMSLSQEYGQVSVYLNRYQQPQKAFWTNILASLIKPLRQTAICDCFNEEHLREEPRGWFYNCNRKTKRHDMLTQLCRIVCQFELLVVLRIIFGELRRGERSTVRCHYGLLNLNRKIWCGSWSGLVGTSPRCSFPTNEWYLTNAFFSRCPAETWLWNLRCWF
jgi:hypothetical protein